MGSQLLWSQHLLSHYTEGQLLVCVLSASIRRQVPEGGTRASTPAPKISLRTSSDFAADPQAGLIELLCTSRCSDFTGLGKRKGPRLATQMPRYERLPWSHSFRPAVRIPLRRVQSTGVGTTYMEPAVRSSLLFTDRRSRIALPPRPQQVVCVCERFGNRYFIFQHYCWEREDCVTLPG